MTTTQNPHPADWIVRQDHVLGGWGVYDSNSVDRGDEVWHARQLSYNQACETLEILIKKPHLEPVGIAARTTTQNPATPLRVPARELRKGDVISMGTIESASPVVGEDGNGYVSIRFETRIGIHGTAFPLDLEVTVISRASGDDPAVDVTSPLVLSARGLKPGMAVIQNDTRAIRVVQAVSPGLPGQDTVISYQGAPDVSVPGGEPMLVTRLSAMAVYHARQEQCDIVTALTELFEQWNHTADTLLDASDPEASPLLAADMLAESRTRRECSAGIHAILQHLQA